MENRRFGKSAKHAPETKPQRHPKSGDNQETANSRRPGCRKPCVTCTSCDASTPARLKRTSTRTTDIVPAALRNRYTGTATKYASSVPSNTTAIAASQGPNCGQRNGCVGSPISLPRNEGEDGRLKKGISGMVDTRGANQNAS